ncbi:hypothetical protein C8R42DRAFT_722294 [Lentinula raphanica]|nr:hypothetical protein C8R42DRAFT_722294 [Lentinula raphanica]
MLHLNVVFLVASLALSSAVAAGVAIEWILPLENRDIKSVGWRYEQVMLCNPSSFIGSKELIVDTFSHFFATIAIIDSFCLPGSPAFCTLNANNSSKLYKTPFSVLTRQLLLADELQRELTYRTWWEPQSQDDSRKLLKHWSSPLSLARNDHHTGFGTRYYSL